ncbi:MAG: glycosyltransferase 87 family protein [Desulfobacteraceae bacterium]
MMTIRSKSIAVLIPFSVLASYLLLSRVHDLSLNITALVVSTALITVILSFSLFMESKTGPRWSKSGILFTALVIRLLFLSQSPTLSDDMFRYYVDGRQILASQNPYSLAPAQIKTVDKSLLSVLNKVNHPDLVTIYPPAAQIVFAVAAFSGSITGFKAVLILMDLCVCLLIILTLEQMGSNRDRSILYAWHPLPVLETASSGHIDTAALLFLFLALFFMNKKSWIQNALSGLMLAASCLVKLFPFVFVPAFFWRSNRKTFKVKVLSFGITLSVLVLVFLPEIMNGVSTLRLYMTDWEFSGFLYRSFRSAGMPSLIIRGLLALVFLIIVIFHTLKSVKIMNDPPIHGLIRQFHAVSFAYLMLTPTLHPWYAIYLVAFLPFLPGVSGICLSWSVFLSYYVLIAYKSVGLWQESDVMAILIFSAPVLAWAGKTTMNQLTSQYK